MSSTNSKISKIQAHFQTLSSLAPVLNSASDELSKAIHSLDQALKKLNIGLTVWVTFADYANPAGDGSYNADQIGYTKLNGEWGLALRHVWGDEAFDSHSEDGPWLFSDAPRDMRLRSTDKIPDVIEKLGQQAANTTKTMQQKTLEVRELANAIGQIANPPQSGPKSSPAFQSALSAITDAGAKKEGSK